MVKMLKIIISIDDYKPWSGAEAAYNRIVNEGLLAEFEALMEEIYPDGLDEMQLNDILWFEDEWVFESLGIDYEA